MTALTLADRDAATQLERLVFFGTPAFSVPTLDALHAAGRTPALVVSQPTRGVGRGRRPKPPPVAQWALDHDVELVQTDKVRDSKFLDRLRALDPSLAVVVAFGQIFRRSLLELPKFGCLNLHASLLPSYRGASPIVGAIRAGERRTGVSTMVMERGLDSGPVLMQAELTIGPNETAGELAPRLSALGAELVVDTLSHFERGELNAVTQDHDAATYSGMLDRAEGDLDWRDSARSLHDLVRAFDPWPGTRTSFRGRPLAIKQTRLASAPFSRGAAAGTVVKIGDDALWVVAGDGEPLGITQIQRPGKRAVSARDFVNGERVEPGEAFDPPEGADG